MNAWDKISSKIKSWQAVKREILSLNEQNKISVFTNGCFDILHLGHIEYLSKAKDLGDYLVVALNSNESVQRLKGPTRPLNSEETRLHLMAAIEFVDAVVIFEEDTPLEVLRELMPTILVKGGDYVKKDIVGVDVVEKNGGKVEIIPFKSGYSTTGLVTKIQNLSKNKKS